MKSKRDILIENGTYNKNKDKVTADDFQHSIFFDPTDVVQVKYEMLRSVEKGGKSITEASHEYGLSRETYYKSKRRFDSEGMYGLTSKESGPKSPHKMTQEVCDYIDGYLVDHPDAKSTQVCDVILADLNISLSYKTIDRYLAKKALGST